MSRTETENAAFWDALDNDDKKAFIAHAYRAKEYSERGWPQGNDEGFAASFMDALMAYCEVRRSKDTSFETVLKAADTFKQVPQHAGSVYDTLPKNIRQANAIYHAAVTEADYCLQPADLFQWTRPDETSHKVNGVSFADVKAALRAFPTATDSSAKPNMATLAVSNAVSKLVASFDALDTLAQNNLADLDLAKIDRRVLAGYCNTLQTPEIAAAHPELQAPVAALAEILKLEPLQQQLKTEKASKAFYSR